LKFNYLLVTSKFITTRNYTVTGLNFSITL